MTPLTDEQMRLAIAESVGAKWIRMIGGKTLLFEHDIFKGMENCLAYEPLRKVPDYLNDLNAIHEAEKALDMDQQETFLMHLGAYEHDSDACWNACHATARQRAEAYLRTKQLWKE